MLTQDEVRKTLAGIFERDFGIQLQFDDEQLLREHLLGAKWGLGPRDLLYLFFHIEQAFQITIPEQVICEGKFSSIDNMMAMIAGQLQTRDQAV